MVESLYVPGGIGFTVDPRPPLKTLFSSTFLFQNSTQIWPEFRPEFYPKIGQNVAKILAGIMAGILARFVNLWTATFGI